MSTDNTTFQYRITFPYLRRRVSYPDREVRSIVNFPPWQNSLLKIERNGGMLNDKTVYEALKATVKYYIATARKNNLEVKRDYVKIMNRISRYLFGDSSHWHDGSEDGMWVVRRIFGVTDEGNVAQRITVLSPEEYEQYKKTRPDIPTSPETIRPFTTFQQPLLNEIVASGCYRDAFRKIADCNGTISDTSLYSAFKSSYKEHLRAHTPVSEQDETALTHLSAYLTGDPYAWCDGSEDGLYAIRQAMRSPDGGSRAIVLTAEEYEAMKARAEALPDVPEDL